MDAQLKEPDDPQAQLSVAEHDREQKLVEIEQNGTTSCMTSNPAASTAACSSVINSEANNSNTVNSTEENTNVNNNVSNTSVNNFESDNSKQTGNSSARLNAGRNTTKPQKILNTSKITGTVKWFNVGDGYGFIKRNDNGEDVFVHSTAILRISPKRLVRSLGDGEAVEFDIVEVKKGIAAANVTGPEGKEVRGSPLIAEHDVRFRSRYWRSYRGNRHQPKAYSWRQEDNEGFKHHENSAASYNYGREYDRRASSRSRASRYSNEQRTAGGRYAPNSTQWRDGERHFSPAYDRNNNSYRSGRPNSFRNEGNSTNLPNSRKTHRSAVRLSLPRDNNKESTYETEAEESYA